VTTPIVVQPDVLDALAADLLGLAADLSTEADECSRAAGSMETAVDGSLGSRAASAGRSWSRLLESLSQHVVTCSTALYTVAAEYRAGDAALAQQLGHAGGVGGETHR
jgi:uncharacterized protein YukE